MIKKKACMLYEVRQFGNEVQIYYSLYAALHYIGTAVNGRPFGGMLVTTAQAVSLGYSIKQYKEFL